MNELDLPPGVKMTLGPNDDILNFTLSIAPDEGG